MSCMARRVFHSDLVSNVGCVAIFVMEAIMHASMICLFNIWSSVVYDYIININILSSVTHRAI